VLYNCAFATKKSANELHNANSAKLFAKYTTGYDFLLLSLHSSMSNLCQNENYGDSKANKLKRVRYSSGTLIEESVIYNAMVFHSCVPKGTKVHGWRSRHMSLVKGSRLSSCHKAFAVVRTSSERS